ncbi:hypothetical protein ACJ7V3_18360 [Halomonas elongata]|uniref:hypothetical protein n=1 Tax=Halomonas elongata TaxID=2746 RepID=UPI0038D39B1A
MSNADDMFDQLLAAGWQEVMPEGVKAPSKNTPMTIEVALLRELQSLRLHGKLILDKYEILWPVDTYDQRGLASFLRMGPQGAIRRVAWRRVSEDSRQK